MKTRLTLLILLTSMYSFAQMTGINIQTPNKNTMLHVSEGSPDAKTFKGVMIPSFTTAERNANFSGLTVTDNGLLIYNTTDNCYNYFKFVTGAASGKWINLCQPEAPTTGIIATYLGAPVMVKTIAGGDMTHDQLASTRPSPINLRLAKDDWLQLDFGNTGSAGTIRLYINNVSDGTITLTGNSVSNNTEAGIARNYTIGAGAATPNPGIDPYNPGITASNGAFGFLQSWSEQVIYTFTATKGSETRKYYAVWTSFPSTELGATHGGVKADLYRYQD